MFRIDAITVLIHRILITNVRDAALSEDIPCEDFLIKERAKDHGGLLQAIGIQLQYPMGLGVDETEAYYHIVGIDRKFMKGNVYNALLKIVTTIFGSSAIHSLPEPHQFV